jgi:hypothetical protein
MEQGSRFSFGTFAIGLAVGALVLVVVVALVQKIHLKHARETYQLDGLLVAGACGDATVTLSTAVLPGQTASQGASPEVFYVCGDDKVTWQADPNDPSGQKIARFIVDFHGKKPFDDASGGVYDSSKFNPVQSGAAIAPCFLFCGHKKFKYKVTICFDKDCKNTKEFDPGGIIMGDG